MTDDKARAERIAKKLHEIAEQYISDDVTMLGDALQAAYELGRRETVEECAPKWISVEERLPEKGVPVLAWEPDLCQIACVSALGNWYAIGDTPLPITHWMPLPGAPASSAKEPRS